MYLISNSNITDSDTDNIRFISNTNNIRFFSNTVADFSDGYRIFRIFLTALLDDTLAANLHATFDMASKKTLGLKTQEKVRIES